MMKKLLSACLLSSALLVGCGGEPAEDADAEGCEHLQEGPAVPVTASASSTSAPEVGADHKRYDISLPAGTAGNTGSVSFAADAATDYTFFLSADVSLTLTSSSGQTVSFESSAKNSASCGTIKGRYVAPLEVGTYTLTFGPSSSVSSVSLVIEESGHEHEH
ncbi:hypothetical protein D187_009001 [Cystobacter fuscus DSM 2262]|uniref:Lipoprotein n=1 Tax=Cystobacter fuscus (strain ATCC 25194 / DSM 2262 / NBRC 100088 / M29) TaxID=1242864 RepID=S9NTD0_CYSF2|nr:hypothetical protein [Cystobacter fuscus]EPX55390.1 hypothetical protein D187_009001 [Cystobacter fuscus DSM 2262]